jgi:hypothetical protein
MPDDEELQMAITDSAAHCLAPIRETPQSNQSSLNREIQTDAIGHQQADHLIRRLRVALCDLGLDGVVPNDWVDYATGGVSFNNLTHRQADYLIRTLEDLAADQVTEVPEPGPGQLSFFQNGQ